MEKNKNISLDELFARAKGEEEIISQEDVRAIVSSVRPVQSITTTTSFISRKGFIMSGLGIVAAGTALFFSLSGQGESGQLPVVSGQLATPGTKHTVHSTTTTPTVEPKKDAKVQKKLIIVRDNGDGTQLALDPNVPEPMPPHTPLVADGTLNAPVEVKGIGIIQTTEADLPKLGLENAPGIGLGFYVKQGDGKVKKYYIPEKGWGVAEINLPSPKPSVVLEPVVITDSRGNKRYMHFADENSMVHMEQYEGDMPDGITIEDEHISSNDNDVIIRKGTIGDNKSLRKRKKVITSNITVSHDSTHTANGEFIVENDDIQNTKGVMVKVEMDNDEEVSTDIDNLPADFNFEMNIGDSSLNVRELVRDAMTKAKIAMKDAKTSMDQARKAMVKVQIEKDFLNKYPGLDTSIKNLQKKMKSVMVMDENFSPEEAAKLDKGMMIRMPDINGTIRAMEAKITAKINTLVPVLVRKATETKHSAAENRNYDNGVIMWFDKDSYHKQAGNVTTTYEVMVDGDMVVNGKVSDSPQAKQSLTPASSSIVSGVSIYPNPVRNATTNIHYTLNEARSVAFSVHDILGKKVVDCGSLAERPAGSYDFELNIGSIPAGIYLVVITTDKGEQTIQRIVIEK